MGNGVLPLMMVAMVAMVAMVPIIAGTIGERAFGKRSSTELSVDYQPELDYSLKYENLPVLPKRAALLFDQLMVALQKVVDNQERGELSNGQYGFGKATGIRNMETDNTEAIPSTDEQTMDLQRRGQAKGRVYWRCYFNAVTCFKRK